MSGDAFVETSVGEDPVGGGEMLFAIETLFLEESNLGYERTFKGLPEVVLPRAPTVALFAVSSLSVVATGAMITTLLLNDDVVSRK